ncbi:MAG TPA: hypothetical protein DEP84_34615 [Chloroflexi bacterium]|nr:hypothetical protein [Chloroflexota bacterium]
MSGRHAKTISGGAKRQVSTFLIGAIVSLLALSTAACSTASKTVVAPVQADSAAAPTPNPTTNTPAKSVQAVSHVHSADSSDTPSDAAAIAVLREHLTRTISIPDGNGGVVELEAVWATASFVRASMPADAYNNWQPDRGNVFILAESVHEGALPDEPVSAELETLDGPLAPSRVEVHPTQLHHRTSVIQFSSQPTPGKDVTLVLNGHQRVRWPAKDAHLTIGMAAAESSMVSLDLTNARVLRIAMTRDGYSVNNLQLQQGEPVIIVFDNQTDEEHHFHIEDLQPDRLRWLQVSDAKSAPDEQLRQAKALPYHICDSLSGICPTGKWVHLHANPGESDAIAFIPKQAGTFHADCPLHAQEVVPVVVQDRN